jgi:hypothetical protein
VTKTSIGVIVLGMHRSGTSLLASLLARVGCAIGSRLNPGLADNPKGYWEHLDIVRTHDAVLQSLQSRWDDPRSLPELLPWGHQGFDIEAQLAAIVDRDFASEACWAVKDPRLCRLLPLWEAILQNHTVSARVLGIVRSPGAVAASLKMRDGMAEEHAWLLWLRHVLESEYHSRSYSRTWILFEDFLARPAHVLSEAIEELGLRERLEMDDLERVIATTLEPDLVHQNDSNLNTARFPLLGETLDATTRLARKGESEGVRQTLDQIRLELARSDQVYWAQPRTESPAPLLQAFKAAGLGREPWKGPVGGERKATPKQPGGKLHSRADFMGEGATCHAFTSSSPNYLGKVLALRRSLKDHMPEVVFHWVVADRPDDELSQLQKEGQLDSVIFATELEGLHDAGWLFQHSLVELCTAIKATAAKALLEQTECRSLLYFDPDILVFSPLPDVLRAAEESSLILTPHLLQPEIEPRAIVENEIRHLNYGLYNLGFFGFGNSGESMRLLRWWERRCHQFCRDDIDAGLFTDQKWMNFAPIFFHNVRILNSPRLNVGPWNISQRQITGTSPHRLQVNGEPLGFYHFSGIDSGAHQEMVEKYAPDNRALRNLVAWYENITASHPGPKRTDWRLGRYDNGSPIEPFHRDIYRSRQDLQREFPDPYHVDEDWSFLRWLSVQGPGEYPNLIPPPRTLGGPRLSGLTRLAARLIRGS